MDSVRIALQRISLLIAIIITAAIGSSCYSQKVFTDIASIDGVESVYVGKTMMKMAGDIAAASDLVAADIIKNIESIEMLSSDKPKVVKKMDAAFKAKLKGMNMDIVLENNDGKKYTTIYAGTDSANPDVCRDLMIVTKDKNSMKIAIIKGEINLQKLSEITASGKE